MFYTLNLTKNATGHLQVNEIMENDFSDRKEVGQRKSETVLVTPYKNTQINNKSFKNKVTKYTEREIMVCQTNDVDTLRKVRFSD